MIRCKYILKNFFEKTMNHDNRTQKKKKLMETDITMRTAFFLILIINKDSLYDFHCDQGCINSLLLSPIYNLTTKQNNNNKNNPT